MSKRKHWPTSSKKRIGKHYSGLLQNLKCPFVHNLLYIWKSSIIYTQLDLCPTQLLVHQRMNAIGYILLKQIDTVRHDSRLKLSGLQQINANITHMIRTLCIRLDSCCAEPVPRAFQHLETSNLIHCLMPSVCFPPLLAAGSPAFPHIQCGPVSPRVHPLLYLTVCYKTYLIHRDNFRQI